jgi:Na+-translocating ferredoxin:NAD+ oxidoreductase RNF subunit RnfB
MDQFKNPMEIFKLLDKSNCRKCNKPTCLAFAAAVFQGQKRLDECPQLDREIIERYGGMAVNQIPLEQMQSESIEHLKRKIVKIDLSSSARRLGEKFSNKKLTIKCLGKDFSVDTNGNISTDIHVHS